MMFEKLIELYPTLTLNDFDPMTGTIILQDLKDGTGTKILEWEHPTLAKPTDEELA
jgi:hypothetical protein